MWKAGTEIRNLEGSSRDYKGTLKRYHAASWIQLLAKHAPELDRHDATQCAAYKKELCKLGGKGQSLFGCHAKLGKDPSVYVIPMCAAHNAIRTTGLRLTATRAFPAFQLRQQEADKELLLERVRMHKLSLVADLEELGCEADMLADLEKRLEELMI